jgi:hypothetical protein
VISPRFRPGGTPGNSRHRPPPRCFQAYPDRLGGYQDYLKAQAINERALVETQAAAEVVRELGSASTAQLKQVCGQIALVKYIHTIMEYGEQSARESLQRNPAKFITLMNACCNMANASIALEKRRLKNQAPTAPPAPTRT